MSSTLARRRSPWWVREMKSVGLHRLAARLWHEFSTDGLSPQQEHLYDGVLSELAYRRRRVAVPDWCSCMFCTPEDVVGHSYGATDRGDPVGAQEPF